ncbi:hypothetical protein CJ178_30840 [Rhodococcus sp. ACPA4]|nr:hypothetical protein CJ178_30840 [Rhodococcus sp. ACPA4]
MFIRPRIRLINNRLAGETGGFPSPVRAFIVDDDHGRHHQSAITATMVTVRPVSVLRNSPTQHLVGGVETTKR